MVASSLTSISGLSTGIDTNSLIGAIIAQKGTSLARLQARKDLNDKKTAALTAMGTSLSSLSFSLYALQDKFSSRTVTSTDTNNTNVTATATGAAAGNYDLTVQTVATKGRISATLAPVTGFTTNLAVTNPTDAVSSNVFTTGSPASFAVQGTDGVIKTLTLTNASNTLNGLRDAINASGAGVTASVVNMGKGPKPYQLVITAKDTGTGTTGGQVSLVDITNMTAGPVAGASANNLGIAAGTVDSLTTPTVLTGGLTSSMSGAVATDASFTLNGIQLTRTTNVVKDAAEGMIFTLKQGGQVGTTTLTVGTDKAGATAAAQDFITKYNALLAGYKTASTSTKNTDGSINEAPLSADAASRALMGNLKAALAGASAGLPGTATYKTLASLGITTQADGTLYLNTNTFQTAIVNDSTAAQRLFAFTGSSSNAVVTVKSGGATTATGSVNFVITKDPGTGALSGALNGGAAVAISNGVLAGTGALAGLTLAVTDAGSGTLTLSRGAGQAANDLISRFTAFGTGTIATSLVSITAQNKNLTAQIATAQSRLDEERANLKKKFAAMEAAVGQMRAAAGSLTGA